VRTTLLGWLRRPALVAAALPLALAALGGIAA
jgi:hypothetical protein